MFSDIKTSCKFTSKKPDLLSPLIAPDVKELILSNPTIVVCSEFNNPSSVYCPPAINFK